MGGRHILSVALLRKVTGTCSQIHPLKLLEAGRIAATLRGVGVDREFDVGVLGNTGYVFSIHFA